MVAKFGALKLCFTAFVITASAMFVSVETLSKAIAHNRKSFKSVLMFPKLVHKGLK